MKIFDGHMKKLALSLAIIPFVAFCALVDVDSNLATTNTALGDIDMGTSKLKDLVEFAANDGITTNVVKDIITNCVVVGQTDWTFSGDIASGTSYSVNLSEPNYTFTLYSLSPYAQLATVTTNIINPTSISFGVSSGTIVASRRNILRNTNGLAMYSDIEMLDSKIDGLDQKIDNMDTSYFRTNIAIEAQQTVVVCPSNQNQTVQYISSPASVNTIKISLPKSGITKDWLVYIVAQTNVTLVLPPANYWCTSDSITNDIPALVPTALYFSQITEDTYSIGRQELTSIITVQNQGQLLMQAIKNKKSARRTLSK